MLQRRWWSNKKSCSSVDYLGACGSPRTRTPSTISNISIQCFQKIRWSPRAIKAFWLRLSGPLQVLLILPVTNVYHGFPPQKSSSGVTKMTARCSTSSWSGTCWVSSDNPFRSRSQINQPKRLSSQCDSAGCVTNPSGWWKWADIYPCRKEEY